MERLNEIDFAHQLEILDKRLVMYRRAAEEPNTWKGWNRKRKRTVPIPWRPASLNYLTVRQLNHVLLCVQHDYLATAHSFVFDGEHYLVKVLEDDKDESHPDKSKEVLPTTSS